MKHVKIKLQSMQPFILQPWQRRLIRSLMAVLIGGWISLIGFGLTAAQAAPQVAIAPTQQEVTTVQVHLGTADNQLRFEPDILEFAAGQRYKLVLDNPSPQKHYFTAKDFADGIWTQKVEAGPVEVKGSIHELELKPTAEAEWVFVPEKPGTYELHCSIPGHTEAGMRGSITIQ
jgi:uncharacterized cupredoxin-like copper-binding protein